jgi:hypothetical protein
MLSTSLAGFGCRKARIDLVGDDFEGRLRGASVSLACGCPVIYTTIPARL